MNMQLRMTGEQYDGIQRHLYPGDYKEAVSFALCGRQVTPRGEQRLLVNEIVPVPYAACSVRSESRVTWSTTILTPYIEKAMRQGLGIVKIHSHPTGNREFSAYDDKSDQSIFSTITCALDDNLPHASLILLPDGELFGRVVSNNLKFSELEHIVVVGDQIRFFNTTYPDQTIPSHGKRTAQAFGDGTYHLMQNIRIGVVGTSGTGSLIIEQLARTGVGEIIALDPKCIKEKNLNRIINSTLRDAELNIPKVEVLKNAVERLGLKTKVSAIHGDLFNKANIREIASCDIVFGCMDTAEGRNLLNRLANFYIIPYFDVGVSLDADGIGGINAINGGVHYLKPGGSSLMSRGVITSKHIQADALHRTDPDEYQDQFEAGYVHGVNVEKPAVMPVNMIFSGLAVVEMLSRLHGFRYDDKNFAQQYFRLDEGAYKSQGDMDPCPALSRHVGRGDVKPVLDMVI